MESLPADIPPSELIKDFVLRRKKLPDLQRAQASARIALHRECFRILNEIFDEFRTPHEECAVKQAEWSILDIEEVDERIILVMRFVTKKDIHPISSEARLQLMNLYHSATKMAEERFCALGGAFVIRPIFA